MFDPEILAAFRAHAIATYPEECVGAITPSGYLRLQNIATDPEGRTDPAKWRRRHFDGGDPVIELIAAEQLLALVHSHPDGPEGPSARDQRQQTAMGIPWGICICNAEVASEPYFWGDDLPVAPLLDRMFRHGPSGTDARGDCGALVRDWYRIERGILLPDCPRDDEWWNHGGDLYREHYARAGFAPASMDEPEIGDVALMQIRAPVPNHAGVYVGDGLVMHHLSRRLSRVEPIGPWLKHVSAWMRRRDAV